MQTAPTRLEFFGPLRFSAQPVLEVAHDACERPDAPCFPTFPHGEDSVLVTFEAVDGDGRAVSLVFGMERAQVAATVEQLEAAVRRLRGIGKSWKRVGICRSCDTVAFDAENPPPSAQCPRCGDTRFEVVQLAGAVDGLRSVASGDVGSPLGCSCSGDRP